MAGPAGARGRRATEPAIQDLKLEPGMVVADFGAGSGYYTERLARAVGPTGRVLAVDLQPEMLQLVGTRAKKLGLTNIELVRSTPDDPHLPAGGVDLILMVDVYHELAAPQRVLRAMKASLSPRGRIAILEFRKEDPKVPIREEHKMSVAQAVQEFGAEGYVLDRRVDSLPWQHLLRVQAQVGCSLRTGTRLRAHGSESILTEGETVSEP